MTALYQNMIRLQKWKLYIVIQISEDDMIISKIVQIYCGEIKDNQLTQITRP